MSDGNETKRPEAANDDAEAPETTEEEALEAELEAAEAEDDEAPPPTPEAVIADLKDQVLRAMAETENTRRRAQRELGDTRKYAIAEFARDLLTLGDNLERALASARGGENEAVDQNALIEGVELTERQFHQVLEKYGIQPIEAEGQKLDPNLHQAMMQIPHPEAEPGTVVQVVQIGYTIHDRLLRPAMVGVAKAPDADATAETGRHLDTEA